MLKTRQFHEVAVGSRFYYKREGVWVCARKLTSCHCRDEGRFTRRPAGPVWTAEFDLPVKFFS
jgi:hypothetical protein